MNSTAMALDIAPQDRCVSAHAATNFTVLCVDDERNILTALRRLLRANGYEVLIAGSGQEGLEVLANQPVDLVLSDMRMPEMDGAGFLGRVRSQHPETLRILLTGYSDLSSTVEAINRGQICRFLSKPWDDDALLAVVNEALERKALEREKKRLEMRVQEQNQELRQMNVLLEEKVAARTTELADANERLKQNFLTSIKVFSNLIELRHPVMAGHSRRVAELTAKLARRREMEPRLSNDLFISALLHDLGKVGLPDELISTPSDRLSGDRLRSWRKHAELGESSLLALDALRESARIIRHHHERWDGNGFPDGLDGEAIPLGARILAVANDFDSFMNGFVTGDRHQAKEALAYIHQGRGSRYDPHIVDTLQAEIAASASAAHADPGLSVESLEPGMVLARDLIGKDGRLLLASDFVLTHQVIHQLSDYSIRVFPGLRIHVKKAKANPR